MNDGENFNESTAEILGDHRNFSICKPGQERVENPLGILPDERQQGCEENFLNQSAFIEYHQQKQYCGNGNLYQQIQGAIGITGVAQSLDHHESRIIGSDFLLNCELPRTLCKRGREEAGKKQEDANKKEKRNFGPISASQGFKYNPSSASSPPKKSTNIDIGQKIEDCCDQVKLGGISYEYEGLFNDHPLYNNNLSDQNRIQQDQQQFHCINNNNNPLPGPSYSDTMSTTNDCSFSVVNFSIPEDGEPWKNEFSYVINDDAFARGNFTSCCKADGKPNCVKEVHGLEE
ncbi:MAG: hypothetical protein MHMPM18_004014 [Marteilia pararefringens]